MSQNPIGTVTDEERLVPLLTGEEGFLVDVTEPVRTAGLPESGTYAWRLREEGDVGRLALAPVDGGEAGSLPTAALAEDDGRLTLEVPTALLEEGLDLDVETYDDDEPLLFEPDEIDGLAVGMGTGGEPGGAVETALELRPVRFADGTPYRDEPLPETSTDSDPVAEAVHREEGEEGTPRPGTVDAPVDAGIVDEVLATADAPRSDVVDALETIARQDVVTEADDAEGDPLVADDRAVVVLDDWAETVVSALALEFGFEPDDEALEAARAVHFRQAEALVDDDRTRRERFEGRQPVVVQPGRKDVTEAPGG